MKDTKRIFRNVDELSHYFAQQLALKTGETPEGSYYSVSLSGGSTPRSIFKYMVDHFREKIAWNKLLIFWTDERCVAPDDNESNYKMTKENLFDHLPIPADNIFRVRGEAIPEDEAERYSEVVKKRIPSFDGLPRFDLMILGLGEDGHTASIFPGNLHLLKSDKLYDVARHPATNQQRVTATGKLINNSKSIVFLVTGEAKSEMVSKILGQKPGSENLPASFIRPVNGELIWLLDEKAYVQ